MADSVNMSLDEIIKQNKKIQGGKTRGKGGGSARGRGGTRGRGGGRGRGRGRGRSLSRSNSVDQRQGRSRSRSRGPRSQTRARPQSRGRSQSHARSRSRQSRAGSRSRSNSRHRRGLTPKGRAGLEEQQQMLPLVRNTRGTRSRLGRLRRTNSNPNVRGSIHSRLGMTTRRGAMLNRPLALVKRGISKRGRGISTGNRYSNVGLRSDQILQEQRLNMFQQNNVIRSQTFTRSRSRSRQRNNSLTSASQLTVSVANDFAKKRRNSVGSSGYLNRQSLAQFNQQFGGYNTRRGPGSVKSMTSNRSNKSNYSNRSNTSQRSRGRGRGGNRGVGRKFVNKQVLNPKLQKEIASIQGKAQGSDTTNSAEIPNGVNFAPTPASTGLTLHQRFAAT